MQVSDYPERPGQPECSYFMKTGECKYKVTCKFHHPKSRINKVAPSVLSDKGLPLRPDQNICSHYSRYGICKYGPACKYDHPVNYSNSIPAGQGYQSDGPVMQQSEARRAAEKEYDATTKMDENVNNVVISSNRAARVAAIKAVQKQMHQRRNSDELPISMV